MGQVQRYWEEVEARGWRDVRTTVCSGCLSDYALVDAVRAYGGTSSCDYCGRTPTAPDASAPVEIILGLVVEGFRYEYEDPIDQVLYSSADGGYQIRSYDLDDLFMNHQISENGQLLNDLAGAIEQDLWVERDPYALGLGDALRWGWDSFREHVMHRRRYTFLQTAPSPTIGAGEIELDRVPAALADAIEVAGQIRVLRAGTMWWRSRIHDADEIPCTAEQIGTPPDRVAKDNRMTPKGIGAFYGAATAEGARAEVAGYASTESAQTIGRFRLLRDLTVVDLTQAAEVPSLFDAEERHKRGPRKFMQGFVKDVARIADPSDVQNLDYIPTQVVAEYFRYALAGDAGPVGGILWTSSRDPSVEVCVLFASSNQMTDTTHIREDSWLVLEPGSIVRFPAGG